MGLAEPRKRMKLSHDPRNTSWTSDTTSLGHRMMLQSGWKPGTALGASSIPTPASEASAAKVKIAVKDDTLGLGASLKSRNVEHQRTGLDAFQGLLGRLNAKDAAEVRAVETTIENKKLAMFAQGRWGGMVFVPGGRLVQEEEKDSVKQVVVVEAEKEDETEIDREKVQGESESEAEAEADLVKEKETTKRKRRETETPEERTQRKAEKKQRKEERQARRLKKLLQKESRFGTGTPVSETSELTETSTSTDTGTSTPVLVQKSEDGNGTVSVTAVKQQRLSNGRHLLRGRNIQAKRLAFSDARGLDQIFMRQGQKVEG